MDSHMTAQAPQGLFVWHELMTTDLAGAEQFYKSVVGWTMTPFAENPSYRMWTANGVPVGGLMALAEDAKAMGAPPHWLPYIGVSDVDATTRQAVGLGARTFVAPQDIPNVGRVAVLADPQGATFAIYRSSAPMPSISGDPKPGEFSWHELATTDWRRAWDFYRTLFGWQQTSAMDMGPAGTYQMFGVGGPAIGGIYDKEASLPVSRWLCYVRMPNVDAAPPLITRGGGTIVSGPMDVPGGDRIVQFRDPQGAVFALYAKVAASAGAPAAKPGTNAKSAPKATSTKSKPRPKVKAKAKTRPKVKAKAKTRPKVKAKAKTRPKVKAKARTKAKAKANTRTKSRKKPKAGKFARKKSPARRAARNKRRR